MSQPKQLKHNIDGVDYDFSNINDATIYILTAKDTEDYTLKLFELKYLLGSRYNYWFQLMSAVDIYQQIKDTWANGVE